MINNSKLVPVALLLAGAVALIAMPNEEVFVPSQGDYSVAEIALREHWIKGAAPILAANFEEVTLTHINKDVEESFVFDVALSQIYEISTDYSLPPIDVRDLNLSAQVANFQQERSEVFCNNQDLKYCELILAWDQKAPAAEFVGLRIEDAVYAIVEVGLAERLGVAID